MSNIDEDEPLEEPHKPFCPKCGSTDLRVSQTHRMLDFLLMSLSLRPHRCRSCRKRFYMRKRAVPELDLPEDVDAEHADSEHRGAADSNAKS
jgi:predicted RNA-binding Zn-ribbon protein involved in translation (DUF1610 family)